MRLRATASVWPTTGGTFTCCTPVETMRVIGEPDASSLPTAGSVRMTAPAGTVALASGSTLTTKLNGVPSRKRLALSWFWPTTSGTPWVSGPPDRTMFTVLPTLASVVAGGSVRMTVSLGRSLVSEVTWPGTNLASAMRRLASSTFLPATSGIGCGSATGTKKTLTIESRWTTVSATGSVCHTWFSGTFGSAGFGCATGSTPRPASVRVRWAVS